MIRQPRFSKLSFRGKSRMERLGKPRHGRKGRRLSEREVSESNPVAMFRVTPRDSSTSLRSVQNDRGITILILALLIPIIPQVHADIPWPEVVQRLAYENEKLARRPQGHNGEYFVVCTLYYTPKESGFTFERGFDAAPVTKPGLQGRKYPRDFLRSVKKEGFGRITTPV